METLTATEITGDRVVLRRADRGAGSFVIADRRTGALLGTTELRRTAAEVRYHLTGKELELTCMLRPEARGQGFAFEAAGALLRAAADELPDQAVVLIARSSDDRAWRLARRLDFHTVATFDKDGAEQTRAWVALHTFRDGNGPVAAQCRPAYSMTCAAVRAHRFGLLEHEFPDVADFSANGLVAVTGGGVVVRTGIADGEVAVEVSVLARPPADIDEQDIEHRAWEEIVDVSWTAARGAASLIGPDRHAGPGSLRLAPPWPGDYRVRVHARGRDDADADRERYSLVVWSAPAAPQVVHRRTDRLGHRLRGEPEPIRAPRPEDAYRWVTRGPLAEAATVTVVTGSTVPEVLRAFGADPGRPQPVDEIDDGDEPFVTVRDTGGAVLVVEVNGFAGTAPEVLAAASAGGRAAGMFWNINGATELSFAEAGRVVASLEHLHEDLDLPPGIVAVLDGLDFDVPADLVGKGLAAVERFTGHGITEEDVAGIEGTGLGYRVAGG